MYVKCNHRIIIGKYRFKALELVKASLSLNKVMQTAVIRVPASAIIKRQDERFTVDVSKEIKRKDAVSITLGYGDEMNLEWSGYVDHIDGGDMLEIRCANGAIFLREKDVNKEYLNASLKEILSDLVSGTGIKLGGGIPDVKIRKWQAYDTNTLAVLRKLKEKMMLVVFLLDGELYAGVGYREPEREVLLRKGWNMVDASGLQYESSKQRYTGVKAISYLKNGSKLEVDVGDASGAVKTELVYNVSDKGSLKELAESRLGKYKEAGLKGSIEAFIQPVVRPGDLIKYEDPAYPDRTAKHLVQATEVILDGNGLHRTIELGIEL